MKNYKDLDAWQQAVELAVETYRLLENSSGPAAWAIADQMRRAALSVPNNIAEAYGRDTSLDRRQFLVRARGSLLELETAALIAERVGVAPALTILGDRTSRVGCLVNGLIRYLNRRIRDEVRRRRKRPGDGRRTTDERAAI